MHDMIKAEIRKGESLRDETMNRAITDKVYSAKVSSKAAKETVDKMKMLEMKAKQQKVLESRVKKMTSELRPYSLRSESKNKEEQRLMDETVERIQRRNMELARQIEELEQNERRSMASLNNTLCLKTVSLNEVVDLMNHQFTKDELLALREEHGVSGKGSISGMYASHISSNIPEASKFESPGMGKGSWAIKQKEYSIQSSKPDEPSSALMKKVTPKRSTSRKGKSPDQKTPSRHHTDRHLANTESILTFDNTKNGHHLRSVFVGTKATSSSKERSIQNLSSYHSSTNRIESRLRASGDFDKAEGVKKSSTLSSSTSRPLSSHKNSIGKNSQKELSEKASDQYRTDRDKETFSIPSPITPHPQQQASKVIATIPLKNRIVPAQGFVKANKNLSMQSKPSRATAKVMNILQEKVDHVKEKATPKPAPLAKRIENRRNSREKGYSSVVDTQNPINSSSNSKGLQKIVTKVIQQKRTSPITNYVNKAVIDSPRSSIIQNSSHSMRSDRNAAPRLPDIKNEDIMARDTSGWDRIQDIHDLPIRVGGQNGSSISPKGERDIRQEFQEYSTIIHNASYSSGTKTPGLKLIWGSTIPSSNPTIQSSPDSAIINKQELDPTPEVRESVESTVTLGAQRFMTPAADFDREIMKPVTSIQRQHPGAISETSSPSKQRNRSPKNQAMRDKFGSGRESSPEPSPSNQAVKRTCFVKNTNGTSSTATAGSNSQSAGTATFGHNSATNKLCEINSVASRNQADSRRGSESKHTFTIYDEYPVELKTGHFAKQGSQEVVRDQNRKIESWTAGDDSSLIQSNKKYDFEFETED